MRSAVWLVLLFAALALSGCIPPAPTATPFPTATPEPTATPTATATPAPTATLRPTVSSGLALYRNPTFGFSFQYPNGWTIEEGEAPPVLATIAGPDNGEPEVTLQVQYMSERRTPAEMADLLLPQILIFPGARVVSEGDTRLDDGSLAYQVTYGVGSGESEARGVLQLVVRGTQVIMVDLLSKRSSFERRIDDIQGLLRSVRLEEPAPFGIARKEALTVFFDTGPLTLDPAKAVESQSMQYIAQIFSGLVTFDRDLRLVPDLAERWAVSPDGRVYTFFLNPKARFHDGRPVTAADVKYSWERAADPATESPTARTYLDDIVGVEEMLAGRVKSIAGVEAVDDRTLKVTIDAPKAYFLSKLTHAVAFVVDRRNVESGQEWWRQPKGTGPFRLKGWQEGAVLALERNEAYHRPPAGLPYVVFRLYGGAPTQMYQTGEIDIATVAAEELEEIQDPRNPLSQELTLAPQLSVFYVGFAANEPPFDDPKVRRAFLLATDRERLVQEVFHGSVAIAQGFLPPGLPGHNPDLEPLPFDPNEAQRLLAASSYGGLQGLPPIVYSFSGLPSPLNIALAAMWQNNLGVDLRAKLVDPQRYYYQLSTERGNLYDFGWIADFPDPQNFLDVLFHSKAENNTGRYRNPQVDSLLEQARLELDAEARLKLYQQAELLLRDDAAAIPLYFGRTFFLTKPYVRGFALTPQGVPDLYTTTLGPRG